MAEAKAVIAKEAVAGDTCLTIEKIMDTVDMLRGAVTIVYPMGLPPHEIVYQEFEKCQSLPDLQVGTVFSIRSSVR